MTPTITSRVFPPKSYASSFVATLEDEDLGKLDNAGNSQDNGEEEIPDDNTPALINSLLNTFLQKLKGHSEGQAGSEKSGAGFDLGEFWRSRTSEARRPRQQPPPPGAFKRWKRSQPAQTSLATDSDGEMSLLKFLAINALDLTAPASDVILKNRTNDGNKWFQLSGHPDSLAPAGPGTVWKRRAGADNSERHVYEELSKDPSMREAVPKYFREVEYQGERFIELQDLLHGFTDPNVMDIKMGTRTFLESEVSKTTARSDLYKKMVAVDPNAPTEEEHKAGAVTKLRYMQFREQQSSTCSQGFRLEAMKCRGAPPLTDLKTVKSRDEVLVTMTMFLGGREDVRQKVLARLREIRTKFEQCEYFKSHEVIGSSVFMIYDDTRVGVWIIDFAKTHKVPDGIKLTHRDPWKQGNHEEGFLLGLDRLISVIEDIKFNPFRNLLSNGVKFLVPKKSELIKS